jgi:hypothetical protein
MTVAESIALLVAAGAIVIAVKLGGLAATI